MNCRKILENIIKSRKDIDFIKDDGDTRANYKAKKIFMNYDDYGECNMVFLFDILHEIGHVETSTDDMSSAEKEYLATTWAIKHSKEFDVDELPEWRKENFQNDINKFYCIEKCLVDLGTYKEGYLPPKESLEIEWEAYNAR